jgi:hypothetical protein
MGGASAQHISWWRQVWLKRVEDQAKPRGWKDHPTWTANISLTNLDNELLSLQQTRIRIVDHSAGSKFPLGRTACSISPHKSSAPGLMSRLTPHILENDRRHLERDQLSGRLIDERLNPRSHAVRASAKRCELRISIQTTMICPVKRRKDVII